MEDTVHSREQGRVRATSKVGIAAACALAVCLATLGLGTVAEAAPHPGFSCQVTSTQPGSRTVTWTPVSGATGYGYKMAASGVGNRYRTVTGTSTEIPVPEGVSVTISMAPRFSNSSPSRVVCAESGNPTGPVAPSGPTAPSNPGTSGTDSGSFSCQIEQVTSGVRLTWTRVSGASGYHYKWKVGSGGNQYRRIEGNAQTSLLLPVPEGVSTTISMGPVINGKSISRVPCGVSTGGQSQPGSSGGGNGSVGVSSSSPIRSNGVGSAPNAGPQCVTPQSNDNFPGLRYGDFLVMNNAWNAQVSSGDWSQCIELTTKGGRVVPSWTFDWLAETDVFGPVWQVKAYPEVIYGTKSAFEISGDRNATGLPSPYRELPEFTIDYAYSTSETRAHSKTFNGQTIYGEKNVAIESFFHSDCQIQRGSSGSNREVEVMIWVEGGPERLPDARAGLKTTVTIDGARYQVWVKGQKDPGYIAFYALDPQRSGTLNLNSFIEWARANGQSYGMKPWNDNWCMANILFGTEIWWGEGTFSLDRFDVTRR